MILINRTPVDIIKFPDGTCLPKLNSLYARCTITWLYDSDSELFILYCIAKKYKEMYYGAKYGCFTLVMPYIPNARMDRIKNQSEVLTMKYFADFINSLGFERVLVFDPHSDVSTALIDRIETITVKYTILRVIDNLPNNCTLFFPDKGAMKRYSDIFSPKEYNIIYGEKERDWSTGEIKSLVIKDTNDNKIAFGNFDVLMIDDIISYGGTLYYSALELKKITSGKIFAYVSHTEPSVLDAEKGKFIKLLNDGSVEKLYTSDSIFHNVYHDKIEIAKSFYEY